MLIKYIVVSYYHGKDTRTFKAQTFFVLVLHLSKTKFSLKEEIKMFLKLYLWNKSCLFAIDIYDMSPSIF